MPNMYIICGCNGAGKTTASYTVLPEIFSCKEYVNADNIAAGISPFNPNSVAMTAGRIMLNRIQELILEGVDFAFETTLATRSYVSLIKRAKDYGYRVIVLFFWLDSPEMAVRRVSKRVSLGGHSIPHDVVFRRYYRGIYNLLNLYKPICDTWIIFDNMDLVPEIIAKKDEFGEVVINDEIWLTIKKQSEHVE